MTLRDPLLAVHIFTGVTGLVLGPLLMRAPKRRGRHTRLGGVYHWNMLAVCVSATAVAALAWQELWWFSVVAAFSYANALLGYLAARMRWRGWLSQHIGGMGGSYIALVTALLVVNAPEGTLLVWLLPTIIGSPLIGLAIARAGRGPLRRHVLRGRTGHAAGRSADDGRPTEGLPAQARPEAHA